MPPCPDAAGYSTVFHHRLKLYVAKIVYYDGLNPTPRQWFAQTQGRLIQTSHTGLQPLQVALVSTGYFTSHMSLLYFFSNKAVKPECANRISISNL